MPEARGGLWSPRIRMVEHSDALVIGGGIVGLATALALLERRPGRTVAVLEKESGAAKHQTGHNSGVLHSGLYYKPGSIKAATCTRGRRLLTHFCEEHGIRFERCGKVVLATRAEEVPRLAELERRARENGLSGVQRLCRGELAEREPHAVAVEALFVPETGIVDYREVAEAYVGAIIKRGGRVVLSARGRPASWPEESTWWSRRRPATSSAGSSWHALA